MEGVKKEAVICLSGELFELFSPRPENLVKLDFSLSHTIRGDIKMGMIEKPKIGDEIGIKYWVGPYPNTLEVTVTSVRDCGGFFEVWVKRKE